MSTGNGGERFVGAAARASGGEAHDLPYRNIRRRAAEAAPHRRHEIAGEAGRIANDLGIDLEILCETVACPCREDRRAERH